MEESDDEIRELERRREELLKQLMEAGDAEDEVDKVGAREETERKQDETTADTSTVESATPLSEEPSEPAAKRPREDLEANTTAVKHEPTTSSNGICPFSSNATFSSETIPSPDANELDESSQDGVAAESVGDSSDGEEGEKDPDIDVDTLLDSIDGQNKDNSNVRLKRVQSMRGGAEMEPIPAGWVEITHNSGISVYLHQSTRVVSLSRPYELGRRSVRRHEVPVSAIPCFHQKKLASDLDNIKKKESDSKAATALCGVPSVQVQTDEEIAKNYLNEDQLFEHVKERFRIEHIKVVRHGSWKEGREMRRKAAAEAVAVTGVEEEDGERDDALRSKPHAGLQLIAVRHYDKSAKPFSKQTVINPAGKTSVAILHEYVQKVVKGVVQYDFIETKTTSAPYQCTVRLKTALSSRLAASGSVKEKIALLHLMDGGEGAGGETTAKEGEEVLSMGRGTGASKKASKLAAARNALELLIPALRFDQDCVALRDTGGGSSECELFDNVAIEDPRLSDMSLRAGQPQPLNVLQEIVKRTATWSGLSLEFDCNTLEYQKHEMKLSLGERQVCVTVTNKRDGKQRLAQAMIRQLHPTLEMWGSVLRLLARLQEGAGRPMAEIRKENAPLTNPTNEAVLARLRMELGQVAARLGHLPRQRPRLGPSVLPAAGGEEDMDVEDEEEAAGRTEQTAPPRELPHMDCGVWWCVFSERRRHIERLWRRRLLVTSDERRARRRFLRLMRGFDAEDVEVIRKAIESDGREAKLCAPGPPMDEREELHEPAVDEDSGLIPQIDRPMSMPYLCCKLWRWKDLQVDAALHRLEALPWCRFGRVTINNSTVSCCNPYHYALWIRPETQADDEPSALLNGGPKPHSVYGESAARHRYSIHNGHCRKISLTTDTGFDEELAPPSGAPPGAPPDAPPPPPPRDDGVESPIQEEDGEESQPGTSASSSSEMIHMHGVSWARLSRWECKERVGESVSLSGQFAAIGLLAAAVHDAQPVTCEWDTLNEVSFALIRQAESIGSTGPEDVWLYNSGSRPLFLCVSTCASKTDTLRRLSPGYCIRVHRGATRDELELRDPALTHAHLVISVGKGWGPNYHRLYVSDTPCRYEVSFSC